jgi:hypothetical protein
LPHQPTQLSWVSLTESKSCMPKMRPRQKPFVISKEAVHPTAAAMPAPGDEHMTVDRRQLSARLMGEPCQTACPENSPGEGDLVP